MGIETKIYMSSYESPLEFEEPQWGLKQYLGATNIRGDRFEEPQWGLKRE